MRSNTGNQTTPGQPHINIIDDYEDDYVEVTGVDEDVEDGWEEVMVASSPPTRKANITTPNILPNTITTTTTTTTTKVTTIPQPIPTQPKAIINNIATITAIPQPVPTQPIAIVNNNVASNNNVINKVQEVLVERVVSVPSQPKEVLQDPDWLAALKANKVPYSATTQGDPQYTAPYVGEPYAQTQTTLGLPYASPQDGAQYLSSISSTVSYMTTTTVVSKEQDESETPYCVAYH